MTKARWIVLILTFWLSSSPAPAQKVKETDLGQKYRDWLELVSYIILSPEKDVFLKLSSDRDRDIFIEAFWKQRDPTPGTPENEFREEHIKRFNHASEFYRRGTTRPGWKTDMGRVYIILGPPVSIQRWDTLAFVPIQGWSYYGDVRKDMPVHFTLLFYQRGGVGEYKLYDPLSDGPYQLLQSKREVGQFDYEEIYEKIYEIDPVLADLSVSIVPGEYTIMGYQPSPQNTIMMANILESSKKNVSPSYATHFLNYKGVVTTDYLTNYVESDTNVLLLQDPVTGLEFVHFSMAPKSVSIDYYEPKSQYYCSFRLDVSLRLGDNIIFQYFKDFPIYFPEAETERVRSNGISIEDSFPVGEGRYRLIILLQNAVGKEFSIYENDIVVPKDEGRPQIAGPILGYKLQDYGTQVHIPFKVMDKKLVFDPKNTFAAQEQLAFLFNVLNCSQELWQTGEVRVEIKGMREAGPTQKAFSLPLRGLPLKRILSIVQSLPLNEFTPDYYGIKLTLADGQGNALDESAANFIVSPESAVPHP
ncbi:MAG: GWxTD domain-containing protein, partial [Acidobacteriota bacterium]